MAGVYTALMKETEEAIDRIRAEHSQLVIVSRSGRILSAPFRYFDGDSPVFLKEAK